jgi:hypothetical protein
LGAVFSVRSRLLHLKVIALSFSVHNRDTADLPKKFSAVLRSIQEERRGSTVYFIDTHIFQMCHCSLNSSFALFIYF